MLKIEIYSAAEYGDRYWISAIQNRQTKTLRLSEEESRWLVAKLSSLLTTDSTVTAAPAELAAPNLIEAQPQVNPDR